MTRGIASLALAMTLLAAPVWAANLVDQVQAFYQKSNAFTADFTQQTRVKILQKTIEKRGQLGFAKPGKFFIRYAGAGERHYLCDGKTLWVYRPTDKEVEVYENVDDLLAREALTFLGGLGQLKKDFKVLKVIDGSPVRIELKPKAKDSILEQLDLAVDPKTSQVVGATLYPVGGNISEYRFTKIRIDPKLGAKDFQFSAPRGVRSIRP